MKTVLYSNKNFFTTDETKELELNSSLVKLEILKEENTKYTNVVNFNTELTVLFIIFVSLIFLVGLIFGINIII